MRNRIIPWKSLPKWVYEQRLSDKEEDLPYWWRSGSGEDESVEFYIVFRPLQNDPNLEEINREEGGVIEVFAMSKHQLLAALRAYRKTFNRFYDYEDYWEEYVKPQWEEYEHDRKHNGGPSNFHSWKRWRKAQKKGKVTE